MSLSLYQPYKPNSYLLDNATRDQGYPGHRSPPPYVGSSPISDDGWAEDPDYDTPYPEKPGWSMTTRHPNYGSSASMRPGRAALHPGSDGGWRRTPGLTSGFGSSSRCPECGKTNQTTDEWGWDGGDEPSSYYYYANVTGYPYGSTPTQTQQHQSRYPRCSFCGQTWSSTTTAYPQQPPGTGRAPALAPAQAEDNFFDDAGAYYGTSYRGYYPQEEWHTGSPGAPHTQFDNASMPYQGPYPSMGTGPSGHYWQQRHQGPYSPSPSGMPYEFQSPYYPTIDAFDRANQGIPVGGYPYRIPVSGAPRRRMRGSYQYSSSFYVTRSTGGMGMGMGPGPYGSEYGGSDW